MRQAVDPNAGPHLITGLLFLTLVVVAARLLDALEGRRGRRR